MKKQILNELLDRYERSKAFREGTSVRRVLADAASCPQFASWMEQGDSKREFLEALEELREEGLLDYSWVRFEKGNLVDKIWLCTEAAAVERSYHAAGRISRQEKLAVLERQICAALEETGLSKQECMTGDLPRFLMEEAEEIRVRKRIPHFFFDGGESFREDERKNEDLLRFLSGICFPDRNRTVSPASEADSSGSFPLEPDEPAPVVTQAREEELERVLSTRLFGDSKYFERELRPKVLSILRQLAKQGGRDYEEDEQLLGERGIAKWPEILEFKGTLKADLDDGRCLDYTDHIYGAYINGAALKHVQRLRLNGISRIISIENKANYTWYITGHQREEELVLYHGGFFSPAKGRFYHLIAEAAESLSIRVYHWSDIDVGGFRIFLRLKKEIFPQAEPMQMDVETLLKYRSRCMPLEKGAYRDTLKRCLADPAYAVFAEVISLMLRENIRLEQEAEL